jgi:pimeloyl-ACP methyl ester carboxylesterase
MSLFTPEPEDELSSMKAVVNGAEVNYIDVGASGALPIVLIHGFPFNYEMWQPQIELLRSQQ